MLQRLRKSLTSVPSITVVGLLSAYLLLGFFVLPAVLAWQLEKQLADRGHTLRVDAVRFNPLRLTLEIDELSLDDAQGEPMLGVDHLMVDLQWRSIIDQTWTIADARLIAPRVRFERARQGPHNFSNLLSQFAGDQTDDGNDGDGALPPLRLQHLYLVNGRIDYLDQLLQQPLVSRIEPLQVELTGLSTRDDAPGRYRVSARTASGASLELDGTLAIGAGHASGKLALQDLQVATLARGLNRELALQSPRGSLDVSGQFDGAIDAHGVFSGGARNLQLALSDLFLQPPGGQAPLLAVQTLALGNGRVDLATRTLHADSIQVADASGNAGIDAQGHGNWQTVLRRADDALAASPTAGGSTAIAAPSTAASSPTAAAPSEAASSAGSTTAAAPPPGAAEPWTVTVGDVQVDRLALALRDAAGQRSATIDALGLGTAVDAQVGGTGGNHVRLPRLQVRIDGLALEQGDAAVTAPSGRLDAGVVDVQAEGDTVEATLNTLAVVLAQGVTTRSSGGSVALGASDLTMATIRARSGGNGARVVIDKPQWQARTVTADGPGQNARIGQVDLGGTRLMLQTGEPVPGGAAGNGIRLSLDGPRLQVDAVSAARGQDGTSPAGSQSAALGQLTVQAQRLALDLNDGETSLSFDALQSQAQDLQWQGGEQTVALASGTLDNTRLQLLQGAAGAQVQAETPALRLSGISARSGADTADLQQLTLQGSRITLRGGAGGAVELAFTGMQAAASQLALARPSDAVQLAAMSLGSASWDMALGTDETRFSGSSATASVTDLQATQTGGHRLRLQQANWTAQGVDGSSATPADGPARTRVRVDASELSLASLALDKADAGTAVLATSASANWSAGSLFLAMSDGPLQVRGESMALTLGQTMLNDPSAASTELVRLGEIDLSGAVFNLEDQSFVADTLQVRGLHASAWLDAQGHLNLLDVLRNASGQPDAGAQVDRSEQTGLVAQPEQAEQVEQATMPPQSALGRAANAPSWRVAVESVDLQDATLRFEDRRREPPLALGLDAVSLGVSGLDTAAGAPAMQVTLGATLVSGGQLQVSGSAALDPQALDLQLAVTDLALAPVQPVLSDYLELTLASGTASTQGRLTYGTQTDAPARLVYTGGFAIDKFLLEEITPKRPFLAWESVRTDDFTLTLQPNSIDIGEVLLDQPVGRLIIAEDQSVNITDVLKKNRDSAAAGDEDPAPPAQADAAGSPDLFPVTVARVKVRDGQLEFADLSLQPQFGTRMHELQGVVTGLGTDANRSAQVQLDARVNQFGSARIRGQISVLQPEQFTDIEMAFRNLDMSALSPYVVKFAGYRIESGRLTLDLEYKVRDGRLQGENQLVMTKAELGEKVESPGALDLPLDLALAILKDSNGVIDIAVPVSGNLNDPQFDYGAVIAKAIGNVIGGIITAPFRALAALFGGGDEPIDTIAFEPGKATLAPPEQQKIETVAKALNERPNLMLQVAPVVAPEQDTPVLQSLIVRSEIARRMGLTLSPDEDPGPIDAANPRVPAAVEAAFGARYAPAVFDLLAQRAREQAAPDGTAGDAAAAGVAAVASGAPMASASAETADRPATSTAVGAAPAAAPAAAGATPSARATQLPPAFYQGLIDRMIKEQAVSEAMLAQLGARRAQAIVQAITGENGGVPGRRVQTGAQRTITDATTSVVPLQLELDVAK